MYRTARISQFLGTPLVFRVVRNEGEENVEHLEWLP
jgi:hypothetical protein